MNKYRFNEEFLKEKIKEGKLVLKIYNSDTKLYKSAANMVKEFEKILGCEQKKISKNASLEDKINAVNHSLNINLNLITLTEWKKLKELCEYMPRMSFKKCNSSQLSKKNSKAVQEVLKFYEELDFSVYESILAILDHEYQLINIDSKKAVKKTNKDFSYECSYLNAPFVNVSSKDDMKYLALTHELRHAADYYIYPENNSLIYELPAIYSEILFADKINNKNKKCYPLYNERINYTCTIMKHVIGYIDFLEKYDAYGRKLTLKNYKTILDNDNESILKNKIGLILKENYKGMYNYIMSTLYSVKLREEYYNGNKNKINNELKDVLAGKKIDFNYEELGDKFIDYIKYVKKLNYR